MLSFFDRTVVELRQDILNSLKFLEPKPFIPGSPLLLAVKQLKSDRKKKQRTFFEGGILWFALVY